MAIFALALISLQVSVLVSLQSPAAPLQSPPATVAQENAEEPISPIPKPPEIDPLKVKLGEALFDDPRLSHDDSRSCAFCHDLATNGASARRRDVGLDGRELPLNTLTVFNSTLNFRFGWEGRFRTIESNIRASLDSPRIMGGNIAEAVRKLDADPEMRERFSVVYGRGPDDVNIVDALANFLRTLLTPDSRFDRWLAGDSRALSDDELNGYHLFKSLGCVSCHQGINIGGNLFQRHGIFQPLASPDPQILRVPSLRNVAATAPYFHDGSAPTLDDAVRKMGRAQLNATLTDVQVGEIVAYLKSLSANYHGTPVESSP